MKRPIKFRGRDIDTGKIVYAELGEIMKTPDPGYLTFIPCEAYYVEADSIAQLVGVDKDGNEVYEDDLVTDKNGDDGFAALLPVVDDVFVTDVGCCSCFNDKCKLKEARP